MYSPSLPKSGGPAPPPPPLPPMQNLPLAQGLSQGDFPDFLRVCFHAGDNQNSILKTNLRWVQNAPIGCGDHFPTSRNIFDKGVSGVFGGYQISRDTNLISKCSDDGKFFFAPSSGISHRYLAMFEPRRRRGQGRGRRRRRRRGQCCMNSREPQHIS